MRQGDSFIKKHAMAMATVEFLYDLLDVCGEVEPCACLLFNEARMAAYNFVLSEGVGMLTTTSLLMELEAQE